MRCLSIVQRSGTGAARTGASFKECLFTDQGIQWGGCVHGQPYAADEADLVNFSAVRRSADMAHLRVRDAWSHVERKEGQAD